jgi:hypothetical protein
MTGFMIRQILLEEDEMGGALTRGGEEKLFIVISLYCLLEGDSFRGLGANGSNIFKRV